MDVASPIAFSGADVHTKVETHSGVETHSLAVIDWIRIAAEY